MLAEKGVSVASMLDAFGDLFDFDAQKLELPDAVKATSFRNPGLIFYLKSKQFAFACEVTLPITDRDAYPSGEIVVLIQFAYAGRSKKTAFGWSIASINLSNLPLLKERLTASQKLALNNMRMFYATAALKQPSLRQ